METVRDFIFLGSKITIDGDCSHEIKTLAPWKESYDKPRQCIKKRRHHFANKGLSSQGYGFSSSHVWCWRRFLRVPCTARRSNQSILKEISPGISLEGMMLKLKLQYSGHLLRRVDSLEKTDAGRDWGQREKGTTEDEMAGWHHWLNGRESEWTPGVGDGQVGLACCDSWGCKESDTTERLNWLDGPLLTK